MIKMITTIYIIITIYVVTQIDQKYNKALPDKATTEIVQIMSIIRMALS